MGFPLSIPSVFYLAVFGFRFGCFWFVCLFVFVFVLEKRGAGEKKEKERENLKQAPCPARGSISQP